MADRFTLRRTAKEVKKYTILLKAASILCTCLIMLAAAVYVISYFYGKFGSFTVTVNKYDMVKQGLTISETQNFDIPNSQLAAETPDEVSNISGSSIPKDIYLLEGSQTNAGYVAYGFYMKNTGDETITYDHSVNITKVTNNVDAAIRVRVYIGDQYVDYAKVKPNGAPESGTVAFESKDIVTRGQVSNYAPGAVTKYTVVMWIEGDDADCVDDIIGGKIRLDMFIKVAEGA